MNPLILVEYDAEKINTHRISELCQFAARNLQLPSPSELSVSFVSNEEMAALNEQYRDKQGPTDVLSFECDNIHDEFPQGETFQAGDIIIAPEVAEKQARELGHSFTEEIDTLLVHGFLHLIGFDHIEDDEAAHMQQHQDALLQAWWSSHEGAL